MPSDARALTLQAMVEAGYITQAEADAAFAEELTLRKSVAERFDILTAPHFALYVLDQIKNGVQHRSTIPSTSGAKG